MADDEKGLATIFCCLFCFIMIILLPFITCDLYFAYNNDSICLTQPITNYSISFDLKTWLLVEGYGNLVVLIIIFLVALLSLCSALAATGLLVFSLVFIALYSIFRLAWLIIGAVMFWGDVMDNCNSQLSGYMWALLIINFVGSFCNIFSANKARAHGEQGGY